jgi:NADH dehydrogenase [ubiquinone] 1 alpha subcomplex assembly factor 7
MSLEKVLTEMIAAEGPLPMARYFELCLQHPQYGYYLHQEPFGKEGDFVTAPEYSQMFGELIGVWCAAVYEAMGKPKSFNLVELGPGKGTLMADMLRAGKVMAGFRAAAQVHFVETSRRLREFQRKSVEAQGAKGHWHDHFNEIPSGPMILVANEFFDIIPYDQYERRHGKWYMRCIGLGADGKLQLGLTSEPIPENRMPLWTRRAEEGAVAEIGPVREAIARQIGERLAADVGVALFIDYGHAASETGDTLHAIRAHKRINILDGPGLADLTSNVDFAALAVAMLEAGAQVHGVITQGEFLKAMGIETRAEMLRGKATEAETEAIDDALQRLTSEKEMGKLVKVMAASAPDMPTPYPFAPR